MKVLITGGAGYIGSTIASACADAGHTPVLVDDLTQGLRSNTRKFALYEGDIADGALISRIVADHPDIDVVVHCAAKTVVPESVADPMLYFDVNVGRSAALLRHLAAHGVTRVIFSSSASVYVAEDGGGLAEEAPTGPSSPYALTKLVTEQMLEAAAHAGSIRAISLRYFNPVGVDPLRRSGPTSPNPTHVLGLLVAAWRSGSAFTLTGTDWPTRDGTGVRDFVHVWDLARAHVRALERFDDVVTPAEPYLMLNVGTGEGTTIRELVDEFIRVSGHDLTVIDGARRPGDVAGGFALVDKAQALLGWRAELTISAAISDMLEWSTAQGEIVS